MTDATCNKPDLNVIHAVAALEFDWVDAVGEVETPNAEAKSEKDGGCRSDERVEGDEVDAEKLVDEANAWTPPCME